ncbi:MAG: zinc-dependent metalloprotease [Planctomycetota bacterium]|nr:zinc-dependent metalloprotease [Planctomycetota bacterium]
MKHGIPYPKIFLPALALWIASAAGVNAQSKTPTPAQSKKPAESKKPEFPPIAQVTKGYEVRRGFITLYVNMKKHRVLGEIPRTLQKRPFLLATSITGGEYAGYQWDDLMVYWERYDRQLVLVEPQIHYKAASGGISEIVKRTYRDKVITTVPIMALGGSGSCLIDLTSLFAGRSSLFVGSLSSGAYSSLSKVVTAKSFPQNVEIEIDMPGGYRGYSMFGGGSAGGLAIHYSISALPKTGYRPRAADDRVGYFVTAHKDFSKNPREDTKWVRYVNRWHLEKADPSLELCEPKKPIEFYIEKTVPIRYRRYIREGIDEWNKAFEKLGILGAIVVHQQTANKYNDLDPEDVRYNFFRWIASENAFAMGPSRVHPETGQILDADIIFDESMIREWLAEYAKLILQGPVKDFHPALREYLEHNPRRHPMQRWRKRPTKTLKLPEFAETDGGEDRRPRDLRPPEAFANRKARFCDFGQGVHHQVNFGLTVLRSTTAAKDDTWPEEFVGQVLKEVVMHEVGHTLGLRHNFKASSWLPLDEINSPEKPAEALSASVMYYNPTNISPAGKPQGRWNMTTLGPYDYWAIEYGYSLKSDAKELQKIAGRSGEKGLAYGTDEDTWSSDPYVYRFDMGSDPLEYSRRRMELIRQTLRSLLDKVAKPGKGYQKVRQAFDMLLYDFARSNWMAARFVGGHHIRRVHKGDPDEKLPIEPVDPKLQREALDLVTSSMFSKGSFHFPPDLLNRLAVGRWYHWGSKDSSADAEYRIHDRILQIQLWSLFDFLNPRTLTLISDAELRIDREKDALTIPDIFSKLTESIWTEVVTRAAASQPEKYTNRKPFVDSLRRNLQHEYVGEVIDIALEDDYGRSPQSARTQAWYHLRKLGGSIDKVLEVDDEESLKLDDYSRAHLEETSQRIRRALEASYSRNGGGGGGGIFYLFGQPAGPHPKAPEK